MSIVVYCASPGDRGSIPGHVIPKTLKMVLDTSLLNTQKYLVRIEGKVEQSRERSSTLPFGVVAIEKGAFRSPSITVTNFTFTYMQGSNKSHLTHSFCQFFCLRIL